MTCALDIVLIELLLLLLLLLLLPSMLSTLCLSVWSLISPANNLHCVVSGNLAGLVGRWAASVVYARLVMEKLRAAARTDTSVTSDTWVGVSA